MGTNIKLELDYKVLLWHECSSIQCKLMLLVCGLSHIFVKIMLSCAQKSCYLVRILEVCIMRYMCVCYLTTKWLFRALVTGHKQSPSLSSTCSSLSQSWTKPVLIYCLLITWPPGIDNPSK